jgi:hypothetical protein
MPQGPIPAAVAQNPSNELALLKTDAEGNLLTTSAVAPADATPITAASGNEANTNAVATLAAATGKTTYIQGFSLTASGATAASVVEATVAGLVGGTMTFIFVFPAGVALAATPLNVNFDKPIPASAADTAIVVTLPAGGSGNTNACANAWGYQQ